MAVIILNISEKLGVPYGKGEQYYSIGVNKRVITHVSHMFEDGLPDLLRTCADAIEEAEKKENANSTTDSYHQPRADFPKVDQQ